MMMATGPETLVKKLPSGSLAPVSFHARVKFVMGSRGLTMEALEELMGRSGGYVSRTLSGARDPRLSAILDFARVLKVHVEWLATGEGPMDQESSATGETFAMLDGWAEAAAELVRQPRWRGLGYAVEAAGRRPVFVRPERVTTEFVLACARFWLDHAPAADVNAAETEAAQSALPETPRDTRN